MSTDVRPYESPRQEAFEDYRALSPAAVTSVLLGLLSGVAFLSIYLSLIPILGLLAGLLAICQVGRRGDELTGRGLAWVGIGLSAFCLLGSWATIGVVYATEVPPGHERISYEQLQPGPGQLIPPRASELEGKKIFIKGYIFPGGTKSHGIQKFLLVRDQGTCCFGGNPKITDRIEVTLAEPLRLTYNTRLNKVAGVFHVKVAGNAIDAGGAVYYHLEADHLE